MPSAGGPTVAAPQAGAGLIDFAGFEVHHRRAMPFDPSKWAEDRRQKMERAEKLRAENRRRLQQAGELPFLSEPNDPPPPPAAADLSPYGAHGNPGIPVSRLAPGAAAGGNKGARPGANPAHPRGPRSNSKPRQADDDGATPSSVDAAPADAHSRPTKAKEAYSVQRRPPPFAQDADLQAAAVARPEPQFSAVADPQRRPPPFASEFLPPQQVSQSPHASIQEDNVATVKPGEHTANDLVSLFQQALADNRIQVPSIAQEAGVGSEGLQPAAQPEATIVPAPSEAVEDKTLPAKAAAAELTPLQPGLERASSIASSAQSPSQQHVGRTPRTQDVTELFDRAFHNRSNASEQVSAAGGTAASIASSQQEKTLLPDGPPLPVAQPQDPSSPPMQERTLAPQHLEAPPKPDRPPGLPLAPVAAKPVSQDASVPAPAPQPGQVAPEPVLPRHDALPRPAAASPSSAATPDKVVESTPRSQQSASNGFHVEVPSDSMADVAGGTQCGAWWANGPAPAWMRRLKSTSNTEGELAGRSELAPPDAVPDAAPGWGPAEPLSLLAPAAPADATMPIPTGSKALEDQVAGDVTAILGRPQGEGSEPNGEAWMRNLRAASDEADGFAAEDPLVFGKPRERAPKKTSRGAKMRQPAPVHSRSAEAGGLNGVASDGLTSAEDGDASSAWMMGLRSSTEEANAPSNQACRGGYPALDDGQALNKFRKQRSSGSRSRRTPEPNPPEAADSADAEGVSGWIAGLRSEDEQQSCSTDESRSFGNPRNRDRPNERKRTERPPRPRASDGAVGESLSDLLGSGGGGSRPSRARPASAGDLEDFERLPSEVRRRLGVLEEDASTSSLHAEERRGVRLPPLDGAAGARGRQADHASDSEEAVQRGRATSQPPVNRKAPKKQKRPRSMGVAAAAPGGGSGNSGPNASVSSAKDEEGGRQMFDKNTLRTNHRDLFMAAIADWRQENLNDACDDSGAEISHNGGGAVRVYLRKRPLFEKEEKQRNDYDVVSIIPASPCPSKVVLHNCLFQADLKTPYLHHLTFDFDRAFSEHATNEEVYDSIAAELVESSRQGGVSTMFMFGQTGSGKTHTMNAIQELAARDLFHGADGEEPWLSVQFVELRGNRCFDLLAPPSGVEGRKSFRPEIRLREQRDGSYFADGAVDVFPKTAEELCTVMHMAHSRRATSATDANSTSSRSHAVCTLRLSQSEGQLMLVDCAGTEWRKDSMFHSKERQQEGAEINASLYALKECIRHLSTHQRVPSHAYRASSLTKILADAFIRGSRAKLAVVCTVSPCTTDADHTVGTLRVGTGLAGRDKEHEEKQVLMDYMRKKPRLPHPKQWSPAQVMEWIANVHGGQFQFVLESIPSNFTGQMLVRLAEPRCTQICGGDEKRGRQLFDLLHQEIHRVEASRKNN